MSSKVLQRLPIDGIHNFDQGMLQPLVSLARIDLIARSLRRATATFVIVSRIRSIAFDRRVYVRERNPLGGNLQTVSAVPAFAGFYQSGLRKRRENSPHKSRMGINLIGNGRAGKKTSASRKPYQDMNGNREPRRANLTIPT